MWSGHERWTLKMRKKLEKRLISFENSRFTMKYIDNNDMVSNSFIWFHSKNETIKREVKLSFGTETILIGLINWNLSVGIYQYCSARRTIHAR